MKLTKTQKAAMAAAVNNELERYIVHCDNCFKIIKEASIFTADKWLSAEITRKAETVEQRIPFVAAFAVALSVKCKEPANKRELDSETFTALIDEAWNEVSNRHLRDDIKPITEAKHG